jgi:copper(I)-binding protein
MKKALLAVLAILAGLTVPGLAQADDVKLGALTVHAPWARASIGAAKAGAAYFTVYNEGEEVDRLVAVASPVAKHAGLHTNLIEDGVAKMRPVEAVEVAPGEPAVLRPGGLHVMFMGLKAPLVEGEKFPLTLTFERAGEIEVWAIVKEATASDGGMDHMEHEDDGSS